MGQQFNYHSQLSKIKTKIAEFDKLFVRRKEGRPIFFNLSFNLKKINCHFSCNHEICFLTSLERSVQGFEENDSVNGWGSVIKIETHHDKVNI